MADVQADGQTLTQRSVPDIMNDPDYATNTVDGEDGTADVSVCRICRGEGSDSEPLFHPCKCSGSIKYVHQDCLMEWLSHSQKKHCELCKTPFRFTKLYSPNMPQSLPLHVLFRHVVIHSAKNLATWLRFCLVITVWLGVLPYTIRQIWRLLFWFSDGGWPANAVLHLEKNSTGMGLLRELQLASLASNGTSPVSPLLAVQTTPASIAGVVDALIGLFTPIAQTLNISSSDPLAAGLFKSLAYGFGIQSMGVKSSDIRQLGDVSIIPRHTSLLSEISFLQNLTRHSALNQLIITITEGYIITFLVVFCFILVFLIREWVVQQQPGINMGVGFNAEFAAAAPERPRELQVAPDAQQDLLAVPNPDNIQEQREVRHRPTARIRRRNPHGGEERGREQQDDPNWEDIEIIRGDTEGSQNRPATIRNALSPAAEIQQVLTEEPRMTEEFLAIWRRADSDPREVLRIIERENKGDQMRYWVNAMRILQNPLPQEIAASHSPALSSRPQPDADFESSVSSIADSMEAQPASEQGSSSSDSWTPVSIPNRASSSERLFGRRDSPFSKPEGENISPDKGKTIAKDEDQPSTDISGVSHSTFHFSPFESTSSTTRPRSISDGPAIRDAISPLAHNNWTFSNLSQDEEAALDTENRLDRYASLKTLHPYHPSLAGKIPLIEDSDDEQEGVGKGGSSNTNPPEPIPNYSGTTEHTPGIVEDGPVEIIGLDGITRVHQNWDEVFANNPVGSGSDTDEGPEPNPFHPDIPLPEPRQPIIPRPAEPQGILGTVAEFLWGGIGDDRRQDELGPNDEHIVQDLAAEAPFVPVAHQDPFQGGGNAGQQDREVIEAAIAAGLDPNDPDAIDDAEDFEGIMELVGMRGPIFSLVQNALFSAFLLSLTVAFGVWIPYNIGRVSLLLIANPGPAFKLPLRLVFGCAAFMQDLALSAAGIISYFLLTMFALPLNIWSFYSSGTRSGIVIGGIELGSVALNISHGAFDRILGSTLNSLIDITDSDIFAFSAASHESLIVLRSLIVDTLIWIGCTAAYIFMGDYTITVQGVSGIALSSFRHVWRLIAALPSFLARPDSWVISLEVGKRASPLDLELSVWGGADRFWAILTGYAVICLLGALYVKKGTPFSSGQVGREWEATIIDLLNQAGGVLKVILIISIEMLVFPLYCGLLLDAALLPLFDDTTVMSRILFTFRCPLTSIFVHWFVGTCYMFHFALFVSMCRKIMRKGVLCKHPPYLYVISLPIP
jgi:E3 ubiquitin-protein ligase MARCH6